MLGILAETHWRQIILLQNLLQKLIDQGANLRDYQIETGKRRTAKSKGEASRNLLGQNIVDLEKQEKDFAEE